MEFIEKAIGFISPNWALSRLEAREIMASYSGAIINRQDTPWQLTSGNPVVANNGLAYYALKEMRDRAKQLCQNNAIASGMLERAVTNIVGSNGFGLHATTADAEWNKQAQQLFTDWMDTADILGNTWFDHLNLACTHYLRDGDFGSIFLTDGRLQPIIPDLIETPLNKAGDPYCVDGVQVDKYGRPLTYYITNYDGYTRLTKSEPIAAKDFCFLSRKKNFIQTRGETCFATSFGTFDQIDQVQQAVLKAWKIQAFFAIVHTKANNTNALKTIPRKGANTPATGANTPNPTAPRQHKIESGSEITLPPGDEIKPLMSSQPTATFPENFRLNIQTLGLELGMPLELMLLDFKNTNYTSARAALLQAQSSFKRIQTKIIGSYLAPIYRWKIAGFIKQGKLADREDKYNHRWIATPFPYLDPVKEIQAQQMAMDCGIESQTAALLSIGRDFDSWVETRQNELAKRKAAGIPNLHSAALQEYTNPGEPKENTSNDIESIENGTETESGESE